jgi:dTMP kinase
MNKRPLFVVIEGGEGAGKSTLTKTVKEVLCEKIVITREPGGSPFAEVIRDVALKHELAEHAGADTMLCLMFAARFDHIRNTVIPALRRDQHVISDRFDASSYAYQIYGQQNFSIENLFWDLRSRIDRLPDLYIYADVEVQEGLRRVESRNSKTTEGNHFDSRKIDFHQRLRKGYSMFFEKTKFGSKNIIINANQSIESVRTEVFAKLAEIGISK